MSAAKPTVLLEHCLKQLRLPTMLREYGSVAASCSQQRCDYPTYLLRLAKRELIDRDKRSAQRQIKAAKFPLIKSLDTFDFAAQPSINEALIRELVTGQYIERRENALLAGNSGTGKTHLAIALAFSACAERSVTIFSASVREFSPPVSAQARRETVACAGGCKPRFDKVRPGRVATAVAVEATKLSKPR